MKPNRLITSKLGLALIGAAALTSSLAGKAEAQLIAYEGFDYTAGENFDGKTGGTGWAVGSSWTTSNSTRMKINDGGLSYLDLVVTGNAVLNDSTSSVNARRVFALAPTTGSVFFSFLFAGVETTTGRWGALLRPEDGTAGPGAVGQSTTQSLGGGGTETDFSFRADQSGIGGLNNSNAGGSAIVGTNLLVVEYNYTTNLASYWANPISLGGAAPAPTVSGISFTDPNDADPAKLVNQFFFGYQDAGSTSGIFDELRVGFTFADVTPVPEPSSALLMGMGAFGLLAWRRRRSS